jgi:hypothetical protein
MNFIEGEDNFLKMKPRTRSIRFDKTSAECLSSESMENDANDKKDKGDIPIAYP